jgi:DNA polymerase
MPIVIMIDMETKSRVDLKACGADRYAADGSTDILCCSFINKDNGQAWLWYPGSGVPAELALALQLADEYEAHNARFDQLIYEYIAVGEYGFPALPAHKWVCTSAQCRVNALPSSLDAATRATNAKHKKDHSGSSLIRRMCVPNKKTGEFETSAALLGKMGKYCMQDSRATVSMTALLRPLSTQDKIDWQINERINDKGVKIDRELAELAQEYASDEKSELGKRLSVLTNGLITAVTQTSRLRDHLVKEFASNTQLLLCMTKAQNDPAEPIKFTLDKAARSQLLNSPTLDAHWHEVIDLIDQGGKSSVAKFTRMLNMADPDTDRVHGAFIFAGAGQTQRYSSKGLQVHNLKRDCFNAEEAVRIKDAMRAGWELPTPVMDTLAKLLRPAIIPEAGHKFVVGDWSAIEARMLPWLADTPQSHKMLGVFREGRDVYVETATAMNLPDRQIGKVAVLSLGFGGAVGAFQAMAKNYGVSISDSEAQNVVDKWRKANKWAPKFWGQLEEAAVKAVRAPETVYTAGRIRYIYVPNVLGGTLMCLMPNDTVIQYPYAKIEKGGVTCMKASVQPKADSDDEWPRMRLWGGFLAENVTQAASACLLREALLALVGDGFPVVAHVHDEVVLEAPDSEAEEMAVDLQQYMEYIPVWAEGLPLKAEPAIMDRYGK